MRALVRRPTRAAGSSERFVAELRAFGLSETQIEAMCARAGSAPRADEVDILGWLAPAWRWFLAAGTQWHVGPSGAAIGLDYPGAEAAARLAGLDVTTQDFARLQICEGAFLAEIRNRRETRS